MRNQHVHWKMEDLHGRQLKLAKAKLDMERIAPVPAPDPERGPRNGPLEKGADASFHSPIDILFISYRKRLADPDNLYGKPILDELVKNKILVDDSAQYVREVSHRQVKIAPGEEECTLIEIYEVEP